MTLTEYQINILSYISDYADSHESLPTMSQLTKKFKRSDSTIREHLKKAGIVYDIRNSNKEKSVVKKIILVFNRQKKAIKKH